MIAIPVYRDTELGLQVCLAELGTDEVDGTSSVVFCVTTGIRVVYTGTRMPAKFNKPQKYIGLLRHRAGPGAVRVNTHIDSMKLTKVLNAASLYQSARGIILSYC
jgi:hypothetical protein